MPERREFGPASPVSKEVWEEHARYARCTAGVRFGRMQDDPREWYSLSGHSEAKKKKIWRRLKTSQPKTAALFDEPLFKELMGTFDVEVLIEVKSDEG